MTLSTFQINLLHQFKQIGQIVAPFEDGGILNYLFEPIQVNSTLVNISSVNSSVTLLKFIEINNTYTFISNMISRMLFDTVQNINVYNVISTTNQNQSNAELLNTTSANMTRRFLAVIIIECLLFLIAFIISLLYFVMIICCPSCMSSLRMPSKYFEISQILKQDSDNSFSNNNNNANNNVNSIYAAKDLLPNGDIENSTQKAYQQESRTLEWLQRSDTRRISTNSSDIYINDPGDRFKQINKPSPSSFMDSMDSSTIIFDDFNGGIPKARENQPALPIIQPFQYKKHRNIYLILKITVYTFIFLLICLCTICLYTMDYTYAQFNPKLLDNSTNQTLMTFRNSLMNEVVRKLPDYLEEIIVQGQTETERIFQIVEKEIDKQLMSTVDTIMTSLLDAYKLTAVLNTADLITQSLNETIIASKIINSQQKIIQDVNNYIGELRGYANILNASINTICKQFGENTVESVKCKELQLQSSILLMSVDTQKFELESSAVMVFLMRDLNIDLNSLTDQLEKTRDILTQKKNGVVLTMKSAFNLTEYLQQFIGIWSLLRKRLLDNVKSFLSAEKQQEIDNILTLTSYLISVIGYLLITLIMSCITLLTVYCILHTVDTYERQLFACQINSEDDQRKVYTLQIYGGGGTKSLLLLELNRTVYLPHINNPAHIKCITITCTVLSLCITIFILSALFLILPVIIITDTEVCRYVDTDSGIVITDLVLDLYLQYEWINSLFTNRTLSKQLMNLLNFPAPKRVYSTLRNKCKPTILNGSQESQRYGLLKLLNYSDIIDFEKILYSPELQQKINETENSTVNEIVKMDFSALIPSDLDSLTTLVRKLSVYLDGKDYKSTIQEINTFTSLKPKILEYLSEMQSFAQLNNQTNSLIDIIVQINSSLVMYDKISASLNALTSPFEQLDANRNLTGKFDEIFNGLNNFRILSLDPLALEQPIRPLFRQSVQSLLKNANILLKYQFNDVLFTNILPCDKLNKLLLTLTQTFCDTTLSGNGGSILCLGSYVLSISLTYFLLLITLLIFVIYCRKYTELCMYTRWENVPIHRSVELCQKLLEQK
ncbi:unnamed protein product [Trichobilharzia szidati]|nr:unnamed protein product [Trichobilharzia szidati]